MPFLMFSVVPQYTGECILINFEVMGQIWLKYINEAGNSELSKSLRPTEAELPLVSLLR